MTTVKFSKRYLLIPIVLMIFFFLFYLIYEDIKDRTIREFNNEQFILAETASQGITSFFRDYQSNLTFLSHIDDVICSNDNSKKLLASFYKDHKDFIEAITRVDASGVIQFTFPENESVIGKDISYQKHVRQVKATHKPVISDVFMSAQGYYAIALHVPVFNGPEFKGSLAMLISIDKLGKMYLGKIKIRGTGNVWLLSERGVELFCPVGGHTGKLFLDNTKHNPTAIEFLNHINKEKSGTVKSVHMEVFVDGKPMFVEKHVVFYRAPLGNTYWTIAISYREYDIYNALSRLRNRLIIVFSFLFVVIAYYFYSLAKVRNVLKEESKRKAAEKTLRESEDRFKKLSSLTFEGILIHNKGIAIDANDSFIKMMGYDREELIGENVIELTVMPEFHDMVMANMNDTRSLPYEMILKRKDGSVFPAELEARDIKYKDESFRVAAIRDISERRLAREMNSIMAEMLDTAPNAIMVHNADGKFLYANKKSFEQNGYAESEFMAMNLHELDVPESEVLFEERTRLIEELGFASFEVTHYHKDGHTFPLEVFAKRVIWKGEPAVLSINTDITERKMAEQELLKAKDRAEESDRLKSAFLANMSHEIRTPMNGILGFAGLLKEPGLKGEEQQKYIRIIEKSGTRMLNIINDIVDISKIEAGLMEVSISETNINEQLDFIFNFFRHEAESKGIHLVCTCKLPPDVARINTDREKLYAILSNLVKNAVKYTRVGTIELGCRKMGGFIEFSVMDTGIGIPAERQHAIFERFIQADTADKMAQQGAGLGLSITRAYVEMLGGTIRVVSEYGMGSVFYFTIPCHEEDEKPVPNSNAHKEERSIQPGNLKVLIAEDDEASLMLITIFMKMFSREVVIAKTGLEAVNFCRADPGIDLILMDIQLPELNGYEAARQIRQFNKDVIIIAQTAFALTGDSEKAIAAGCNDYIAKPVKKPELLAMINKYFN